MAPNSTLKTAIFLKRTTQTLVAQKAGVQESRLSRIIHGYVSPSDDEKRAIARALRLPVEELFPASEAAAS